MFFPLVNPSENMRWGGHGGDNKAASFEENHSCVAYQESNEYVQCGLEGGAFGPKMATLPSGISAAPVKFVDVKAQKTYDMKFVAGFFGVDQDEKTLEVTPEIGWLIAEK